MNWTGVSDAELLAELDSLVWILPLIVLIGIASDLILGRNPLLRGIGAGMSLLTGFGLIAMVGTDAVWTSGLGQALRFWGAGFAYWALHLVGVVGLYLGAILLWAAWQRRRG